MMRFSSSNSRTRRWMMTMAAAALLLPVGLAVAQQQGEQKKQEAPPPVSMSEEEVLKHLEEKDRVVFLDVREPKELAELGTLEGYVNIPLGQLEGRLSELPKDKLIITACNRAIRASKARDLLEKNGFKVLGACALNQFKSKKVYPALKEEEKK